MKLIYDTQAGAVLPWSRHDEADVVGLASHLLPMTDVEPVVTQRGLRRALSAAGLLEQVETLATATADNRTWWFTSPTVRRNHPFVAALATALDQTSEQVDALFEAAADIDATL